MNQDFRARERGPQGLLDLVADIMRFVKIEIRVHFDMNLDEALGARRPRSQIMQASDLRMVEHDCLYPLAVFFGKFAVHQLVE